MNGIISYIPNRNAREITTSLIGSCRSNGNNKYQSGALQTESMEIISINTVCITKFSSTMRATMEDGMEHYVDNALDRNLKLLRKVSQYKKNWDLYGANPISRQVIEKCESILRRISVQPEDVDAIPEDRIGMDWTNKRGDYLCVQVTRDEKLKWGTACVDKNGVDVMIDESELEDYLAEFLSR